ncbi:50S ribosomal protein L6 [Natranaerofaba carboxydovora]|uniref:50S ribosomal protein L6 n=1 Tax=Natranaerofaba carboxydovora TaxID=2742683 RepID=UPI001F1361E2|nr:50S ribosomal protein L6 [Natranaerofaba carboxydovora]
MSRIGVLPIKIPDNVEFTLDKNKVKVKGPKGELERTIPSAMIIKEEEGQVVVERPTNSKKHKSLHGLTRSLINNLVEGVVNGYEKTLEIHGVGYRAKKEGNNLVLNVGYSHPVTLEPPEGIEIDVPKANIITVKGIDKEKVGQITAQIRDIRPPEPYKGKGIRYQDEKVISKVGKAGG